MFNASAVSGVDCAQGSRAGIFFFFLQLIFVHLNQGLSTSVLLTFVTNNSWLRAGLSCAL